MHFLFVSGGSGLKRGVVGKNSGSTETFEVQMHSAAQKSGMQLMLFLFVARHAAT